MPEKHQRKSIVRFLILSLILIFTIRLWADTRTETIDLIIALDTSRSMKEEFEAAKEYIINDLITRRLIVGDYFLVIGFNRYTEVITDGMIHSDKDKKRMIRDISLVKANGFWTDMGTMFDRLRDELVKRSNNNRRKRFIVITDDINEPPPDSPYYTKDGKPRHEYLTKIDNLFEYPGWKIQILSIATDPVSIETILDYIEQNPWDDEIEGWLDQMTE